MNKCHSCGKQYDDEHHPCGRMITDDGILMMGYPSQYDMNIYQFMLVEGWYCWSCLDREIKEGLCQPLFEWKGGVNEAMEALSRKSDMGMRNWRTILTKLSLEEDEDGTLHRKR